MELEVHKFGGTSLGTRARLQKAAQLIREQQKNCIVVASAVGGVTQLLVDAIDCAVRHQQEYAEKVERFERIHVEMGCEESSVAQQMVAVKELMHGVYLLREASARTRDAIMGAGELLSAPLLASELGCQWVDARELIVTNEVFGDAIPDLEATGKKVRARLLEVQFPVVITGFIGATAEGLATTLGRSGSDFSATILASCVAARRCVIWTDVNGVYSANPALVPEARTLPRISFAEASELSFFGAKVIHPKIMIPLRRCADMLLEVRNAMDPQGPFTCITSKGSEGSPSTRAVSSLQDVGLVMLEGDGLRDAVGFSARCFQCISAVGVSVIMIAQSSSEKSLCLVIAEHSVALALKSLRAEFQLEMAAGLVADLLSMPHMAVVSLVGDGMRHTAGVAASFFGALCSRGINVAAIAQAASETNISAVVRRADITEAVRVLHLRCCTPQQQQEEEEEEEEEEDSRHYLLLLGAGLVGSAFLKMAQAAAGDKLVLLGVATSSRFAFDASGLSWSSHSSRMAPHEDPSGHLASLCLPRGRRMVVVDATASQQIPQLLYTRFLQAGAALVTPNKRGSTLSLQLWNSLRRFPRYRYEAAVLAGLPVISTLQGLLATGDKVRRIEGVFSGTLAYIFYRLRQGDSFSQAVSEARTSGYTEPDPRDDLNGVDVARKLLILARVCGVQAELSQVQVESLVPGELHDASSVTVQQYLAALPQYDEAWRQRCSQGSMAFVASWEADTGQMKVGPVSTRAYEGLSGADNVIRFFTARYPESPLTIQGAGAGADVTASGMLMDVLQLIQ